MIDASDGFHDVAHFGLSYHDAIAWQNREVIICMHDAYELSFSEEDAPTEERIGGRERQRITAQMLDVRNYILHVEYRLLAA